MMENVESIQRKRPLWQNWIVAGLVVGLLVYWLFVGRGIVFETVDDLNVLYSVAGYKTGSPYYWLTFYDNIAAWIMGWLYRLTGKVQWYSVLQLGKIAASNVVILYTLLRLGEEKGLKRWPLVGVYLALFLSVLLYPMQRMQFTTTACLLGTAACCLIWLFLRTDKRGFLAASCVFLLLSFLERHLAGFVMGAFWGSFLAVSFLGRKEKRARCVYGAAALGMLVLLVGLYALDHHFRFDGVNAEYMTYDRARSIFQDFVRPSWSEGQELYESVGWDKNVYNIAAGLIYIDPVIRSSMIELSQSELMGRPLTLREAFFKLHDLVLSDAVVRLVCCLFGVIVLLALVYILSRRKTLKWTQILHLVLPLLLSICLVGYLTLQGRMLLRLIQLALLPSIVLTPLTICAIEKDTQQVQHVLLYGLLPVLLVLGALSWERDFHELRIKDNNSLKIMGTFVDYATAHPENIYVHDYTICNPYNSYDAFICYDERKPTNIIVSGGSYTWTGCYHEQLRVNGLEKLDGETLLQDNVYYVCDLSRWSKEKPSSVINYLKSRYGRISAETVEELTDSVVVMKFTKK